MKKRYLSLSVALITTAFIMTGCGSKKAIGGLAGFDIYESYTSAEAPTTQAPTTQAPTTQAPTTQVPTTQAPTTEAPTTEAFTVKATYEDILRISTLKATCETDYNACYVNVYSEHNPYDVVWDYGKEYQAYVDACDWSLVWDYNYYINTFPMLAVAYHYDEDLLLEHFQTVGIHEGRQGSAGFNVEAFKMNSNCPNYNNEFAAYFFDYMLKYDSYKNVNTVYKENGKTVYTQYKTLYTIAQTRELNSVNAYRAEVNAEALYAESELTYFANFRCYVNLTENYYAHDWFAANNFESAEKYSRLLDPSVQNISENCIHGCLAGFPTDYICATDYRASQAHYEAMIDTMYDSIGVSHIYHTGKNYSDAYQFDMFIDYPN